MESSLIETNSKKVEETIINCNKLAMEHLKHQNLQSCFILLQKAEEVLRNSNNENLKAITLNNLGSYYKRMGKLDLSLKYLKQALDWSPVQPSDRCNLASTYLNICAIKSRMGKHQQALKSAQKALQILQHTQNQIPTIQNTKIITLHNIAIQNEFLSRIPTSLKAYKQALEKAQTLLGPSHQLTLSINTSYLALTDTQKFFQMKSSQRRRQAKTSSPATRKTPVHFELPNIRNISNPKTERELRTTKFGRPSVKRKALKTAPGKRTKILSQVKKPVRPKTYYSESRKDQIEQKLNSLQSQLKSFEAKYQKLELKHHQFISSASPSPVKILPTHIKAHSFSVPFSSGQARARKAAVDIQRLWRGYKGRLECKGRKRLRAQIKAQKAIQDFEAFKREVLQENFYQIPEIQRPSTNQRTDQRVVEGSLVKTANRFFDRKFTMDFIPRSQQSNQGNSNVR